MRKSYEVSVDNYGFFLKNAAPNLIQSNGQINKEVLISSFGYQDSYQKPLELSTVQYREKYESTAARDRFDYPVLYLSFFETSQDNQADINTRCNVAMNYELNRPVAYCTYKIYGKQSINDYRPYNTEALNYIKHYIRNL